ncbi:iron ABC transporter permease [Vallitalea longa]|uniref:Iron ABC transporter permease n=1 Tax=Vallitalea longa TaxID=2936439 RepID=A0A9W5YC53_9FIRM|nr:iron ABC transporter permease [Vallitalea longa]GKX28558.1 iron ABC transporter permease [Vallitalea longa]
MKYLKKFFNFWNIVRIIAFIILAVVLVFPFFSMLRESFISQETGNISLTNYLEFFRYPYYYKTLFNSLSVVIAATIFSTLIGLPMAYITTRYNIWGKPLINIMIILSLLSPPFIGAYSWILLLGRNGFITNLFRNIGIELPTIYGWSGIVLVFTLKFFPYVYLFVSGALKSMDSSIEEAAENLGVSGIKKLLTITFPLILPTITAGALMVFMTSLADFGTPMLIGEGYKVLPVLIYEEYMSEIGGNASIASMLSVIIIICAVAILLVQKLIISKKSYMMSSLRPPKVTKLTKGKRIGLTILCVVVAGFAMIQQVVVVITSFIKTKGPIFVKGFSLDSYRMIINKLSTNIKNTFLYSTVAIIIMVVAGLLLSYLIVRKKSRVNSLLDILIMFPYVIPGAVLGISLLVAFNKGPILLAGTAWIMIISYVIRKLPYTIRSSTAILYQIDPSIEEASINLGVSPMKTFFKTTARLMAPGVISGAILSWITTINELSSSIILYTGKTATISVAIYTEVVRASFGTAAALASILTVTTVISILVFNKISGGKGISL